MKINMLFGSAALATVVAAMAVDARVDDPPIVAGPPARGPLFAALLGSDEIDDDGRLFAEMPRQQDRLRMVGGGADELGIATRGEIRPDIDRQCVAEVALHSTERGR